MSTAKDKQRTRSFVASKNSMEKNKFYSPEKNVKAPEKEENNMRIRFGRKDLQLFEPQYYVTGQLKVDDVIDLKEVFDTYDSTGMGVLLPNDLNLLLNQNGYTPNKNTVYELIAEYDSDGSGGIGFGQFLQAIAAKPYLNETKK